MYHANAAGGAQCRQGGGDDARQHLQNRFPTFLFHGKINFKFRI